jgi:ATP synthase protein I
VLGQLGLTAVIALLCLFVAGPLAAKSAALGGGISALASLAMALLAFGQGPGADAQRIARGFYVGEGVKLAVMIAAFVVVLRTTRVSMGAMFGAYVATFFVYWLALANALPAFKPPASSAGEQRGT